MRLIHRFFLGTMLLSLSMIAPLQSQYTAMEKSVEEDAQYFEKGVAVYQQSLDSAITYFKKGIPYYEAKEDWTKYVNCHNAIGTCNYYQSNYQEAFKYFHLAIKKTDKLLGQHNMAYTSALNNLGRFHSDFGDYDKALNHYKKAVLIEESLGNKVEQVTLNNNIGLCLLSRGDIDEALQYYKRGLRVQKEIENGRPINFAGCYYWLANGFKAQNKLDTAYVMMQKALSYYDKSKNKNGPITAKRIINSYWTLAEIALDLKKTEEFKANAQKAQYLERKHQDTLSAKGHQLLGTAHLTEENFSAARSEFEKTLAIHLKTYQGINTHPDIGKTHCLLAKSYLKEKDFDNSVLQYQLALNHFTKGNLGKGFSAHPKYQNLTIDLDILQILHGKAKSLCALAEKNTDQKVQYLAAAEHTFDLAIKAINHLRKDYFSTSSKEALAQESASIYEDALKCIFFKYQNNPDEVLLEKALQLVESGKAAILLESINENTAKGFAGIPDSLIQKENTLKSNISNYQQRLLTLQRAETPNSKQIEFLEAKLFTAKNEHQSLLADFEVSFPEYHQLKYNQRLITVNEIKSQLPDEQTAFIEYFVAADHVYAFYITKKEATLHRTPLATGLNAAVESLRSFLHQVPSSKNAAADFKLFTSNSNSLFEKLIEPIGIDKNVNRLIIIPDDVLGYIPFEILLQDSSLDSVINYSPKHLNYLINDFKISYHYSATLWKKRATSNKGKGFLGFAPSFKSVNTSEVVLRSCEDELYQLKCNTKEIENIKNIIGGKALKNDQANTDNFQQLATEYKVLHFATHSCLDDENPMLNKIFLTNDYINNFDLYNIKLNAELAVLSACNTGNGPLLKGEGVMSLFRGFLHAGCPSSLISFWSVEDCTTQGIMTSYYQQLKAGKTKDEALQMAKKDYLQTCDRLKAHPFYWAPFVQFGNIEAIDLDSRQSHIFTILLGFGLLTLLMGIFFRKTMVREI